MGTMGFANLVAPLIGATGKAGGPAKLSGTLGRTHFKPKAKRVIYLFMSGGPSHIDMFDYHPKLREYHGQELPDSIRNGQRITGMTSKQSSFPALLRCLNLPNMGKMELVQRNRSSHCIDCRRYLPNQVHAYRSH